MRSSAHACSSPENGSSKARSEEHTSELQSRSDLVCRLLLEKKKKKQGHQRFRLCHPHSHDPRCKGHSPTPLASPPNVTAPLAHGSRARSHYSTPALGEPRVY